MSASETTTQDAIELLTADHREVEQLFTAIESLPPGDERDRLVQQVTQELSVHAAVEEQVLYPAMRQYLPDGDALVDEAIDEHQEVKETLAAIERSESAEQDPHLQRLTSSVRHHVEEEEGELFTKLQEAVGPDDLRDMGAKMAAAKKMAPTHPHPNAPNTPPGNIVGGAAAGLMDKARDALKGD